MIFYHRGLLKHQKKKKRTSKTYWWKYEISPNKKKMRSETNSERDSECLELEEIDSSDDELTLTELQYH